MSPFNCLKNALGIAVRLENTETNNICSTEIQIKFSLSLSQHFDTRVLNAVGCNCY